MIRKGDVVRAKVRQPGERAIKLRVLTKLGPFLVTRSNSHICYYVLDTRTVDEEGVYTLMGWRSERKEAHEYAYTRLRTYQQELREAAANNPNLPPQKSPPEVAIEKPGGLA